MLSGEESGESVEATLDHLEFAVEAKLAVVAVAGQAVEQVYVVEHGLHPER